ncbi:DUF2567 domain-containing protein [Williamsia sp. SKLECPSW1]
MTSLPTDEPDAGTPPEVARLDLARTTRVAGCVVLGVAVVCATAGIVWGLIVPGVTGVVVAPGRAGTLGADTGHRFDAVALFACVSLVAGVIGGVGAWWARPVRGSVAVVAATAGAMAGSAVAVWIGGLIASARLPGPSTTPVGGFFRTAPSLRLDGAALDAVGALGLSWAVVIFAPLGVLLAYLPALLMAGRADLGVETPTGDGPRVTESPLPQPDVGTTPSD